MNKSFTCCQNGKYIFQITYSVAGKQKTYSVCQDCEKLECFQQHIVTKEQIA